MPDFFYIYDRVCLATLPCRFWEVWEEEHRIAIAAVVNAALEEAAVVATKARFKAPEAIRAMKLKD